MKYNDPDIEYLVFGVLKVMKVIPNNIECKYHNKNKKKKSNQGEFVDCQ